MTEYEYVPVDVPSIQNYALNYLASGKEEDFNKLYYRIQPGLLVYVKKLLSCINNPFISAEDVVSESIAKAYSRMNLYDESQWSFSTWIYKITYNTFVDEIRRTENILKSIDFDTLYYLHYNSDNYSSVAKDDLIDTTEECLQYEIDIKNIYDKLIKFLSESQSGKFLIENKIHNVKTFDIAKKYNMDDGTVRKRIYDIKNIVRKKIINSEEFDYYEYIKFSR